MPSAMPSEHERLYRLRKSCERGLLARDLVSMQDEVQNELLAIRIEYRGESMPLRNADAKLAVLDEYADREELGDDPRRRDGDDERAAARGRSRRGGRARRADRHRGPRPA